MPQTHTLKIFGTGQVTIPKIWRDESGATHFRAKKMAKGVLLEPVKMIEELVFDPPMPAKEFNKQIKAYRKKYDGK